MRCARHYLQRARVASKLIHKGGEIRAICGSSTRPPLPSPARWPGLLPFSNPLGLSQASAFSSDSATVLNGHVAPMADAQEASAKPGPLFQYKRRVESGDLMAGDENQERALRALQALYDELVENATSMELDKSAISNHGRQHSWFWTSFLSKNRGTSSVFVRGLYLYGGVGTGKTMLMDLFYDELPDNWRKRRTHFHDFMLNVHSRLRKQQGKADPLQAVAEELSNDAILLCLDEFMRCQMRRQSSLQRQQELQPESVWVDTYKLGLAGLEELQLIQKRKHRIQVTDVADALILNRLFGHLFKRGVVLVTTSNRAPDQLYEGGLQRDLFLPFIALLKERCITHAIGSLVDYRKLNSNEEGFYFCGEGSSHLLIEKFRLITDGNLATPTVVEVVMGRKLQVPFAANGCAYFQFFELCEMPLGAADYIGLFSKFHTLALEGIPSFGSHNRVAAYRFVTLVDVMYENKGRLLCSAEDEPVGLFKRCVTVADAPQVSLRARRNDDADLCVDNELGFAKERTISRLTEMNSKPYLEERANLIAQRSHQTQDIKV